MFSKKSIERWVVLIKNCIHTHKEKRERNTYTKRTSIASGKTNNNSFAYTFCVYFDVILRDTLIFDIATSNSVGKFSLLLCGLYRMACEIERCKWKRTNKQYIHINRTISSAMLCAVATDLKSSNVKETNLYARCDIRQTNNMEYLHSHAQTDHALSFSLSLGVI